MAPHPDDEVLGVGGTTALLAAAGARLRLPDTRPAACEDELAIILREQCAGFDMCLAPWEADAHADHEAAGRAARRAARQAGQDVLTYPIWMWHWAKPGDLRVPWRQACRVPLSMDVAARKRSATDAFASQLTDRDGAGPVLPAGIVAHFTRRQEVLLR